MKECYYFEIEKPNEIDRMKIQLENLCRLIVKAKATKFNDMRIVE